MAADVEAQPRDVELSALEAEKQPMAGPEAGPEKNGLVKAAGPGEAAGAKFTGLGKEELLRAAAAPGWARARTALLALFWLGWLGMLAAAAAIVARAPRCQAPLGADWWRLGALYRAPPKAFGGDLKGVEARLGHLAELHVGGLLLGPLHPPPSGDPRETPLGALDPELGTEEELGGLLGAAREKGVQVLVELTPAPQGDAPWVSPEVAADPRFRQGLKEALGTWLERGVGGVFLDGIEHLEPSFLQELQNVTEQHSTERAPRLLVGGTRLQDPPALLRLLNASGLRLVLGPFLQALGPDPPGPEAAPALLQFLRAGPPLAWSVGTPWEHRLGLSPPHAPQLLLLLLGGLPGSPLLNYGDELGLRDPPGGLQPTPMPWDLVEAAKEGQNSTEARLLSLCRRLGELRGQERVLAGGGAEALEAGPVLALLREGGAEPGGGAERFLVLLNPGAESVRPTLAAPPLPPRARLVLSTHRDPPGPAEPLLELGELELGPYEGLLLALHDL